MKTRTLYPRLIIGVVVLSAIIPNAAHVAIQPVLEGCGFLCAALFLAWASSK